MAIRAHAGQPLHVTQLIASPPVLKQTLIDLGDAELVLLALMDQLVRKIIADSPSQAISLAPSLMDLSTDVLEHTVEELKESLCLTLPSSMVKMYEASLWTVSALISLHKAATWLIHTDPSAARGNVHV